MQSVNELLRDAKETCSSAKMSFLGVVTCWLIADESQYSTNNIISEQYIVWPDTPLLLLRGTQFYLVLLPFTRLKNIQT